VEPVAEKTQLGWIVKGFVNESNGSTRVQQALGSTDIGLRVLDQMCRFFYREAFETEHQGERISPDEQRYSLHMAVSSGLLDRHPIKLEVGYEAPVLWKDGARTLLPDNRALADARLYSVYT